MSEEKTLSLKEKIYAMQTKLAVGKSRVNQHGKFNYRSATDIIEASRELRKELRIIITPTESIELIGDRYYMKVTLLVEDLDSGEKMEVIGYAREPDKAAMLSESQTTGAASSYAEKNAYEHLFLLSDSDRIDPDSRSDENEVNPELKAIWDAGYEIASKGDLSALRAWFDSIGDKKHVLGKNNWVLLQNECKKAKNGATN